MILPQSNAEIIDAIPHRPVPGARWCPHVGEETLALLDRSSVPENNRALLQQEAIGILSRCVPPTSPKGQETGLVIGYVQSGKTASFTTVAALARDNGYRLIVVLSGLTLYLFNQSKERLEADLGANEDRLRWLSIANPRVSEDLESVAAALRTKQRTVLLTVMKNRSHLEQLIRLLSRLPLNEVPTIVVDDEADQASLNNEVRSEGESATYRRLVSIRERLPHHTYLQYTATPQAPLLINLIDVLSPQFVEVLTPGSAYTGGKVFFEQNLELVRPISASEIPTKANHLMEPPPSLLSALRVFFLGVAAGWPEGRAAIQFNRSMMIHPSMRRAVHAEYFHWVQQIKRSWQEILTVGEQNPSDPDYLDLLEEFRQSYQDLKCTVDDLAPFDDLSEHLRDAIGETIPREVNSSRGRTPEIDWRHHYSWILVGGEVLNRGFTVRGLTVTYMPRSLGTGQADTIQQRARWFGYKEDYLGYCRVYLSDQAINAYKSYVDHEEYMRNDLRQFAKTGQPLSEWKRRFFLSPALQPTRHMVLDQDYVRGNYADAWYAPKSPQDSEQAVRANRDLVAKLVGRYEDRFHPDAGHPLRTEDQHHLVASGLSLEKLYADFLTQLVFTSSDDSAPFTGLLLQVARYLEDHPSETCTVYQMKSGGARARGLDDQNQIKNLFQGRNPDGVSLADAIYPGDREIHAPDELTIQLHRLDLTQNGAVVAQDIPAVAVWVPKRLAADWISQSQG